MGKYLVKFNRDKCKGCELCVSFCPKKILEIDKVDMNAKGYHPANVKPGQMDECIGCMSCALMCPDNVISVYELSGDEK